MLSKSNKKIERKERAFQVFIRAKRLGKTNRYFSRIHRRSPASITLAFQGKIESLLNKIEKHISYLEQNNGGRDDTQE